MKTKKSPKTRKSQKSGVAKNSPKRILLFDHVKHIRQVQNPDYYNSLSEDDRKSFNPFMIIRALSMDSSIVEDMASLYQIFDKIPTAQLYTLLIGLVTRSQSYHPWIKSKFLCHDKDLLGYVAKRFEVSTNQANVYVNILLRTEEGQAELIAICRAFGLTDTVIDKLFDEPKYD